MENLEDMSYEEEILLKGIEMLAYGIATAAIVAVVFGAPAIWLLGMCAAPLGVYTTRELIAAGK